MLFLYGCFGSNHLCKKERNLQLETWFSQFLFLSKQIYFFIYFYLKCSVCHLNTKEALGKKVLHPLRPLLELRQSTCMKCCQNECMKASTSDNHLSWYMCCLFKFLILKFATFGRLSPVQTSRMEGFLGKSIRRKVTITPVAWIVPSIY